MIMRKKSTWILAGLAGLGAMHFGERESRASGTTPAITINGGYNPKGGDPFYQYDFDVYLNVGSSIQPPHLVGNTVYQDSFTIQGLPGIDPTSTSSFIPAPPYNTSAYTWGYPTIAPYTIPNPPPGTPSYGGNVQWAYTGLLAITATTSQIFLGEFTILTTYDYPPDTLPLPNNSLVTYSYDVSGQTQQGTSNFPIVNLGAVPEPSSVALLLVGAGAIPLLIRHERRRTRHRGPQAA